MVMLNSTLPEDIRVLSWAPVGPDFSARFNCLHRTYKYFFPRGNMDIDVRYILQQYIVLYSSCAIICFSLYKSERNLQEMRVGAQKLVGEHDFRNFCRVRAISLVIWANAKCY